MKYLLILALVLCACDNRTQAQKCEWSKRKLEQLQKRIDRIAMPTANDVLPLEWVEEEIAEYCK